MKSENFKRPPKNKLCRSYKNFNLDYVSNTLKKEFNSIGSKNSCTLFGQKFLKVINKHASLKTKLPRSCLRN